MLDQQQRHQYLELLGVSSWLPVTQLPAAADSADWVWDFQYPAPEICFDDTHNAGSAKAAVRQPLAAPAPVDPAKARAVLNDVLGSLSEPAKTEKNTPKAQQVEAPKPTVADKPLAPPRFCLAFIRLDDWLLVDAVPPAADGLFSAQLQAFVVNIAPYLPVNVSQCPAVQLLKWPMLSGSVDQGREQAVAAVRRNISNIHRRAPLQKILLLGEMAAHMVLDCSEPLEQLSQQLVETEHGLVGVSCSLTQAMRIPGAKAELWQVLANLKEAG